MSTTSGPAPPNPVPPSIRWNHHIEVLFSVLLALSVTKIFELAVRAETANPALFNGSTSHHAGLLALAITAGFIAFDNWRSLFAELVLIDIDALTEVWLYLIALIPYASLPFLYGATSGTESGAARWMIMDLIAVLIADALRRISSLCYHGGTAVPADLLRRYRWFIVTGILYSGLLGLALVLLNGTKLSLGTQEVLFVSIWPTIRAVDYLVIRYLMPWLTR
jgi:hypothetical protein